MNVQKQFFSIGIGFEPAKRPADQLRARPFQSQFNLIDMPYRQMGTAEPQKFGVFKFTDLGNKSYCYANTVESQTVAR